MRILASRILDSRFGGASWLLPYALIAIPAVLVFPNVGWLAIALAVVVSVLWWTLIWLLTR